MENKIKWTAPEFIHYPKSIWWFVAVGGVGATFVSFFAFQKEFLVSLLFLLLTILVLFFSKTRPRTLEIQIDGIGVKINELKLSYQQIKSFWIVYEPPEVKTLNFETTAYLNRFFTLQLQQEDPVRLREFLLKYLPEDLERGEQFADQIGRKLRF